MVPAVEAPSPERTGAGGVLSIHLIFAFRKTGKLSLEFREGNGLFCWSRCSVRGQTEELWDCWCGDRLSTPAVWSREWGARGHPGRPDQEPGGDGLGPHGHSCPLAAPGYMGCAGGLNDASSLSYG